MIVFSNTTPLIALSSIGQLPLLRTIFHEIRVVDVVARECAVGGKIVVSDFTHFEWIHLVNSFPCEHDSVLMRLDAGEKHTLNAAVKTHADLVIIDEKLGRNIAEYLGLTVTGTLGVLLKAKQMGVIPSFIGCVRGMLNAGIRYNTNLVKELAAQVNETFLIESGEDDSIK